jgi:hypothetical protein
MEIKIEVIEMPNVDEVRAVSALQKEQIAYEMAERQSRMEKRATDDLPRFIRYINSRIDTAKMNGHSSVCFSYNSEGWAIKDPRCDYTFKGTPNSNHARFVSALYEELGFNGYVHSICCNNSLAYRDGEVYISW